MAPGLLAVVASLSLAVPGARATFPGRDGTLAVQPLSGPGLILIGPGGARGHRLCPIDLPCGRATAPSWSADGRLVAFGLRTHDGGVEAMYPDGSCFTCVGGPARPLAAQSAVVSFGDRPFELTVNVPYDGVKNVFDEVSSLIDHPADELDWSAGGRVALVVHGHVFIGWPPYVTLLGPGDAPSWSPTGQELTYRRGGWIVTVRPGRRPRRLVRGTGPVYSPDGRRIAFFDRHHRLRTIAVSGGRERRVGSIRGRRVAWQPLLGPRGGAREACAPGPGQRTIAATAGSEITRLPVPGNPAQGAVLGCAASSGEPRFLGYYGANEDTTRVDAAALSSSGATVALAEDFYDHETGTNGTTVSSLELRTGRAPVNVSSARYGGSVAALVVDDAGATAAIVTDPGPCQAVGADCGTDSVVADARTSTTLASRQLSSGNAGDPYADLSLGDGTVGWTEDGIPHSAPLP